MGYDGKIFNCPTGDDGICILNDGTMIENKRDAIKYLESLGFDIDTFARFFTAEIEEERDNAIDASDYHERQQDAYFCHLRDLSSAIEDIASEMESGSRKQKKTFAKALRSALTEYGID